MAQLRVRVYPGLVAIRGALKIPMYAEVLIRVCIQTWASCSWFGIWVGFRGSGGLVFRL